MLSTCCCVAYSFNQFPSHFRHVAMCYSFDFAQQLHHPSKPLLLGPNYFVLPRKCVEYLAVCCEAIPRQINYLTDKAMCIIKGSNAVISYFHHFFQNCLLPQNCKAFCSGYIQWSSVKAN